MTQLHCRQLRFAALACALAALAATTLSSRTRAVELLRLPAVTPLKLEKGHKLAKGPDKEISGIVKSRRWPDLYWTHNDSGNEPRIYAVHRDGSLYKAAKGKVRGVQIRGAENVDWEDIAADASGHIIVADTGNNDNDRRDLALYYLDEPAPDADRAEVTRKLLVAYPEQRKFPPRKDELNFDAETLFALGDQLFLCTKRRTDGLSSVYRVDAPPAGDRAALVLVDQFDVRGKATGADATADGKQVVVLTYEGLWLFDVADATHPLSGAVRWLPLKGTTNAEAVCFADDATLLVGDEAKKRLYEAPLERFVPVPR